MYDEQQHVDLFERPGEYLFRGHLAPEHAEAHQSHGVTPTSVDPIVATLFACRWSMDGPAVVYVARKVDLADRINGPNLSSRAHELAVHLDLSAAEFVAKCVLWTPLPDAITIVRRLGYRVPDRLPDVSALTLAVSESPKMTLEDIERYVAACRQLAGE